MDSATNDMIVENGSQHSPKSPSLQERESRGEVSTVATHECTPEHAPKSDVEKLTTNGSSFAARPSFATDPEPLRNLIVNYLPPMMDEEQLWALFGQFGPIESVKIIYDKETRESRGYGFVKYVHFFSASFAANSLNGYCIAGKRLKVAYANVDAAWEAYNLLRASAMMFSSHQQTALQNVFCQQILLARQEEERRRQRRRRRRRGFWQEFTKSSMPKTALPAVRGGGISPGKKTLARRTVANHISFDAALFSVACAAGCDVVHAPGDVASILCKLAIDAPRTETGSGGGKNTVLDAEVIILEAVEIVLAGYNELRLLLSSPSAAKDAEGTAFTSRLMRASLVNLRTLAMFLSQRPPFSSPVLAALFQLTILVVKHAPLEAIDQEGCRVLVSFLELLGCLPRGVEADGLPSIQRVARITARNVMRRVGPRLFISVPPPASPESSGRAACSAVGEYQVDRDLIPWMERHLLPLHVVTGAGAQADLKEDRRLALSLLDFVLLSNDTSSLTDSRRLSMHYLADAVASLLEEEEEEIGLAGHERDVALAFLNRVDRALSATAAAPSIPSSHLTDICKEHLQQPPLTARSIREFLRAKDAAYVSEFAKLHKRIEEEQESQAALQREFAELTEECDRGQRELEEDILNVFNMEGSPSPSGAIVKGDSPRRVAEETASPSSEKWVQNIMSLLSPVDELTIALHEEQLRHITTM